MIRFTAPTTWYQNNFNLTRRSRTLALAQRLLSTFYSIPPATWIYVIDFKKCTSSFRSTWIEGFKSAGTLLEKQTDITLPSTSPSTSPRLFKFSSLLGSVRLGSIRNKNNWNNASKRLFGSYSHSGIPGFQFRLFYTQERNSRNIFRNKFAPLVLLTLPLPP